MAEIKYEGEIGKHGNYQELVKSGMVVTNLDQANWDEIFKMKESKRDIPKKIYWTEDDITDVFGYSLQVGDRILRACECKYPDYEAFKKGTVKKIDLKKRENPIGILTDGNERIGWSTRHRLISQKGLIVKI